jgi:hypothetical protein
MGRTNLGLLIAIALCVETWAVIAVAIGVLT